MIAGAGVARCRWFVWAAALGFGCAAGKTAPVTSPGDAAVACAPPTRPVGPPSQPGDKDRPWHLSEAGLYASTAGGSVACNAIEYEPTFALWSDGSHKRRWLQLPAGAKIDTDEIDHFRFPVGTRLWKEFSRGGRRIETRLIERVGLGDSESDYFMGAFLWNNQETDAAFVRDGATTVHGTDHDVPSAERCWACHKGEPGRVLGVSALQLGLVPKGGTRRGASLDDLGKGGLLSTAIPSLGPPVWPDNAVAALGYLHANCGHCHNNQGPAWRESDMVLRLFVSDLTAPVVETRLAKSTLNVDLQKFRAGDVKKRNPNIRLPVRQFGLFVSSQPALHVPRFLFFFAYLSRCLFFTKVLLVFFQIKSPALWAGL